MNRKQKVDLLKSIIKGKTTLNDLQPKHFKVTINGKDQPQFFINSKPVSEETYHEEISKLPTLPPLNILLDGIPIEEI